MEPPRQHSTEWESSLCNCSPCSSCLLACFLPCILFGKTADRMKDPTMETSEAINGECLVFGAIHCFTGCGWIYNLLQRSEIREKYGIQGSGLGDCCTSYWCLCCALIQQDNEVKRRAIPAGPITQGYQSQKEGMQMPAPAYVQPPQHDMEQGIQQAYPAGQQPMHYPPGVQGQEKQ